MKSIRLSMVAYFLILLSAALGTVSWLVYQESSKTMREKEKSTADLFTERCRADIQTAREAFDQNLLAEADKFASLSKEAAQHAEFYYPLGMLAVPAMPAAHWLMPLWVAEAAHPGLVGRLSVDGPFGTPSIASLQVERLRLKGAEPHIDAEEASEKTADRPYQYLQIERPLYHYQYQTDRRFPAFPKRSERPELMDLLKRSSMVRHFSESLGDFQLPMSDKERELEDHHFDEIAMPSNKTARRVTIKRTAKSGRVLFVSPDGRITGKVWCLPRDLKFASIEPPKTPPTKGAGKGPMSKGPVPVWAYSFCEFLPLMYVHYAEDTSALEQTIAVLESKRDRKLAELTMETQQDLDSLRRRLGWIGLTTFFSILVGSWLLIRLGLSPLSRLSDAVSKVSARDFRLHIDPKKLPKELLPIAGRLSETLEELGKAFAREKQAAADISHELRTPLASLLTTAEVGLKKPRTPEEYRELLLDCKLSGDQMMQLVERLLALARLDANADRLRTAPVDVANLAQQCASLVRPLADARGLSLQVHADSSVPILADGGKLREVLTNLLHNAIQYNRPDGTIELTVERQNGHLLMEVRDTGIGISEEARTHIFERFYRADPSRHSDTPHAGLGLAIVKSYVDLMGGRIDVDSSSGGSTFRVQVPAVDAEQPATSFAPRKASLT